MGLVAQARELEQAGADILLVEGVPGEVGPAASPRRSIPPVIGIGAGNATDGQILVLHDLLGVSPGKRPKFSKDFLAGSASVSEAVRTFIEDVRTGRYPDPEHTYT